MPGRPSRRRRWRRSRGRPHRQVANAELAVLDPCGHGRSLPFASGRRSASGAPFDIMTGGRSMNVVLWILQVLLALVFLAHGWLFLAPPPEIKAQMDANLPQWFQSFMGIAE